MAVRTISTKLAIEGEAEYRNSVSKINSELKTLGSELKLVESNFKGQANSQAALVAKGDVLQRTFGAQSAKVKELEAALKNAQNAQQTYGSRIDTINAKITANDAAMDKLKVSTLDTSEAQAKLAAKTEALKRELEEATAKEAAAAKGVNDWQRQVNNAQADLNSLNSEIKQNGKYLDEAKKSTDKCATSIDNYGKQTKESTEKSSLLQKIFAGGFLANIASQAVSSLIGIIKSFGSAALKTADELKGLTAETGLSATELQKLKYIGADVGVEVETMATSMKRIVKSMDGARDGTGEAAEAYRKLGVSVTEANGELRDGNTVYGEVLDALGKMTNETERDALAQTILGRSATELNALIELGSDGMKSLGDEAERTGAVMSEDAVTALDATGDALDHAKQSAEAFVGEALADIIGTGKTASETMSDLQESLNKNSDTQNLIDKYRSLSVEIANSSLTSDQLSTKTAELEQAKQDLIAVSGGVVTAIGLENGTFDNQVALLENATQSEREYLKYKSVSIILENSGTEALKKKAQAKANYDDIDARHQRTVANIAELEKQIVANRKQGKDTKDLEDLLGIRKEEAEILSKELGKMAEKMADVTKTSADAENAMKTLVNNGLMSAEEACSLFNLSADELNAILNNTSETAASTIPEINDMAAAIEGLNAEYQAAYDSALASLEGQYNLWANAPAIVQTSVEEMQNALDSNTAYFTNYKANIEALMAFNIPGVDMQPLIDSISDGTPEAAARAQALADAIASGNTDAVAALAKSAADAKTSQENLAAAMGKAATDYDAKMQKIVESTAKAVKDMDISDDAKQSGINTLQGYINGVNSQSGALNLTMTNAAQAALTSWKKVFKEASPSRAMRESGENSIKGAIIGVENMQGDLVKVYSAMGENLMNGLSLGMKDSSGKVMSTADDIAKELSSRLSDMMGVLTMSSDVAGLKFDLWEMTLGKGASSDEKTKKELESLNEQAELQKQQVETTQEALSKMTSLYGANSEESLKLQKQLLQEQIAYEKLKESIDEVAASKSSVDTDKLASMADQEYKLWYINTPDASDAEKLAKQAEVLNLKIGMQGETVSETEEALADMVSQYGANADESIKLQEELLKEKIAYAELEKAIKAVTEAKSKYDTSSVTAPSNFLQAESIWKSFSVDKAIANTSGAKGLTTQEVGSMIATAVNAVGTIVANQPPIIVQNPLYINDRELVRAITPAIRAFDSSSPQVRSDKL